jgi:hypothetical protein
VTFTWDPPVTGYVTVSRGPGSAEAAGDAPERALFLVSADPEAAPVEEADAAPIGAAGDDDLTGDDLTGDPLTDPRAQPLLLMPSQVTWTDVVPRRVASLTVSGLEGEVGASVLPLPPAALASLPRPSPGETQVPGLLGLTPPERRTATQSEVRRRLVEERREGDSP